MRMLEFTKRNFKEIFRDPISWLFMLVLPVALFVVLEIMVKAIGQDISYTPQFEVKHLTISMIIFSFSFLTIFTGNNLAKDREEKFLLRLKSTPMKPIDFVLGYTLSSLPFAFIQEVVIIITGMIFGLKFTPSLFLVIIALLPVSLIFLGFGILFGSLVSSKGVGGISSIVPTASSLLGGMFFPLSTMQGGFKKVCISLPFASSINIGQYIIGDSVENILVSVIICVSYTLIIYMTSVIIFNIRLHEDSI